MMSNTEKKLDALIDALGFDVEEVRLKIKPEHLPLNGFGDHLYDTSGTVNGYYLSTHVVDYKLTKRIEPSPEQTKKMRIWLGMGYRLGI